MYIKIVLVKSFFTITDINILVSTTYFEQLRYWSWLTCLVMKGTPKLTILRCNLFFETGPHNGLESLLHKNVVNAPSRESQALFSTVNIDMR